MNVRTRFAPSPTGTLHIGSVRTALFSWLYARHHAGQFVLRIEDTDKERSTPENVDAILDGMAWLGLDADEGPYFQSQRMERYEAVIERFLEEGHAYRCYCTKEELEELRAEQMRNGVKTRYDGRCRSRTEPREGVNPVVRFRNPQDGVVVVDDKVRGRVVFQNAELDDLIIARSDGSPTYNFTVIVDDHDMEITHVIRGDDHLNNTPRQMNMLRAMGVEPPVYAHLPMILGEDGAKLSKRHGAVDVREYRAEGYLPEALLNYLVRLGWSHGDQEVFTIDEMIELFDIADVNHSASAFNPEKLRWLDQQHIIAMRSEELGHRLLPYLRQAGLDVENGPDPVEVARAYRERADTLLHMAASARYCYEDFDEIEPTSAKKHLRPVVLEPMKEARNRLAELLDWTADAINRVINESAEAYGINMGKLGQPIRVAVTGGPVSPPIDVTAALIGQERTLARLDHAINLIEARAAAQG
ncbi:glutamate--tRNA ligase [Lentisalinibacter orientalis]|uniref:glutamate--tRNA ligase n=1 Tax=Lentisalinibacter orientalis TaxID=2992241 RepID=UPI0038657AB1